MGSETIHNIQPELNISTSENRSGHVNADKSTSPKHISDFKQSSTSQNIKAGHTSPSSDETTSLPYNSSSNSFSSSYSSGSSYTSVSSRVTIAPDLTPTGYIIPQQIIENDKVKSDNFPISAHAAVKQQRKLTDNIISENTQNVMEGDENKNYQDNLDNKEKLSSAKVEEEQNIRRHDRKYSKDPTLFNNFKFHTSSATSSQAISSYDARTEVTDLDDRITLSDDPIPPALRQIEISPELIAYENDLSDQFLADKWLGHTRTNVSKLKLNTIYQMINNSEQLHSVRELYNTNQENKDKHHGSSNFLSSNFNGEQNKNSGNKLEPTIEEDFRLLAMKINPLVSVDESSFMLMLNQLDSRINLASLYTSLMKYDYRISNRYRLASRLTKFIVSDIFQIIPKLGAMADHILKLSFPNLTENTLIPKVLIDNEKQRRKSTGNSRQSRNLDDMFENVGISFSNPSSTEDSEEKLIQNLSLWITQQTRHSTAILSKLEGGKKLNRTTDFLLSFRTPRQADVIQRSWWYIYKTSLAVRTSLAKLRDLLISVIISWQIVWDSQARIYIESQVSIEENSETKNCASNIAMSFPEGRKDHLYLKLKSPVSFDAQDHQRSFMRQRNQLLRTSKTIGTRPLTYDDYMVRMKLIERKNPNSSSTESFSPSDINEGIFVETIAPPFKETSVQSNDSCFPCWSQLDFILGNIFRQINKLDTLCATCRACMDPLSPSYKYDGDSSKGVPGFNNREIQELVLILSNSGINGVGRSNLGRVKLFVRRLELTGCKGFSDTMVNNAMSLEFIEKFFDLSVKEEELYKIDPLTKIDQEEIEENLRRDKERNKVFEQPLTKTKFVAEPESVVYDENKLNETIQEKTPGSLALIMPNENVKSPTISPVENVLQITRNNLQLLDNPVYKAYLKRSYIDILKACALYSPTWNSKIPFHISISFIFPAVYNCIQPLQDTKNLTLEYVCDRTVHINTRNLMMGLNLMLKSCIVRHRFKVDYRKNHYNRSKLSHFKRKYQNINEEVPLEAQSVATTASGSTHKDKKKRHKTKKGLGFGAFRKSATNTSNSPSTTSVAEITEVLSSLLPDELNISDLSPGERSFLPHSADVFTEHELFLSFLNIINRIIDRRFLDEVGDKLLDLPLMYSSSATVQSFVSHASNNSENNHKHTGISSLFPSFSIAHSSHSDSSGNSGHSDIPVPTITASNYANEHSLLDESGKADALQNELKRSNKRKAGREVVVLSPKEEQVISRLSLLNGYGNQITEAASKETFSTILVLMRIGEMLMMEFNMNDFDSAVLLFVSKFRDANYKRIGSIKAALIDHINSMKTLTDPVEFRKRYDSFRPMIQAVVVEDFDFIRQLPTFVASLSEIVFQELEDVRIANLNKRAKHTVSLLTETYWVLEIRLALIHELERELDVVLEELTPPDGYKGPTLIDLIHNIMFALKESTIIGIDKVECIFAWLQLSKWCESFTEQIIDSFFELKRSPPTSNNETLERNDSNKIDSPSLSSLNNAPANELVHTINTTTEFLKKSNETLDDSDNKNHNKNHSYFGLGKLLSKLSFHDHHEKLSKKCKAKKRHLSLSEKHEEEVLRLSITRLLEALSVHFGVVPSSLGPTVGVGSPGPLSPVYDELKSMVVDSILKIPGQDYNIISIDAFGLGIEGKCSSGYEILAKSVNNPTRDKLYFSRSPEGIEGIASRLGGVERGPKGLSLRYVYSCDGEHKDVTSALRGQYFETARAAALMRTCGKGLATKAGIRDAMHAMCGTYSNQTELLTGNVVRY